MTTPKPLLLAIAVAVLPFATSLKAITIFSDNFTAGTTLADNGWYAFNSNVAGAVWTKPTLGSPTTGYAALTGAVMQNPRAQAANTIMTKQWAPITLANTGDYFTLSLDVQTTSTTGTLGIYVVNAAAYTANSFGGTSPLAGANGYAYAQDYASTSMKYRSETSGTAADISTNTGSTTLSTVGTVGHTVLFTITRTATGLSLASSLDGNAFTTQAIASPLTYTFNSVTLTSFSLSSGSVANFDNISVVTSVPEPTTLALVFGSLGIGLLVHRRRTRSAH